MFCCAGAIIGGILGTLAALTLLTGIACLIACCRRRRLRNSKNNPFSDDNIKKQQQQRQGPHQHPHHRPAWLNKLPGFSKKQPPAPAYAPRGPPAPRPGPPYGPNGPTVPGPYTNGSQNYSRSASGRSGGQFYGISPQGPPTGSFNSSRGPIPLAAYGPPSVVAGGRGGVAYGVGAEELQDGLQDLKYIVSSRLLPAVDNASLITGAVGALPACYAARSRHWAVRGSWCACDAHDVKAARQPPLARCSRLAGLCSLCNSLLQPTWHVVPACKAHE